MGRAAVDAAAKNAWSIADHPGSKPSGVAWGRSSVNKGSNTPCLTGCRGMKSVTARRARTVAGGSGQLKAGFWCPIYQAYRATHVCRSHV